MFGNFPHHSTFTFSPVKDFVSRDAYSWLGNLFFLGAYSLTGIFGLQLFRLFVLVFAVGVVYTIASKPHPLTFLVLVIFTFGIKQKLLIRTAIFSVPGMVMLLWCWIKYDLRSDSRYLWLIPVIFVIWSNIHGSYVVGVSILFLMMVGVVLDDLLLDGCFSWKRSLRYTVIFLLVISSATFIKPYPDYTLSNKFSGMIQRVLQNDVTENQAGRSDAQNASIRNSESDMVADNEEKNEDDSTVDTAYNNWIPSLDTLKRYIRKVSFGEQSWRSGEFAFPLTMYFYLFVAITLSIVPLSIGIFLVNVRDIRLIHLLPVLGALFLSLGYLRTVGYLPLVVVPVSFWKFRQGDFDQISLGKTVYLVAYVGICLLALNLSYRTYKGQLSSFFGGADHKFRVGSRVQFSSKMPSYTLNQLPEDRILVHYNLSGYMIWKWWPFKKVFIDTKGSAYRDSFFAEYGNSPPGKLATKNNLEYLMMPMGVPRIVRHLIPKSNWAIKAFDEGTILFEKVNVPRQVDPLNVCLLSGRDYRMLSEEIKTGMKSMINIMYKLQNISHKNSNNNSSEDPNT